MSLFSWRFKRQKEEDALFTYLMKRIEENNRLQVKEHILIHALRECSYELYKRTGEVEYMQPEYWIEFINKKYGFNYKDE